MQYFYSACSGAVAMLTVACTAQRLRLTRIPADSKKVRYSWAIAVASLLAWMLLARLLAEVNLNRPITFGLGFVVGLIWICIRFYDAYQINLMLRHLQVQKNNWHRRHCEKLLGAQSVEILFTIFALTAYEILLVIFYCTGK